MSYGKPFDHLLYMILFSYQWFTCWITHHEHKEAFKLILLLNV